MTEVMFPHERDAVEDKVRRAWPKPSLYKLYVGGGLYVEITPAGSKRWRFRYRIDGKDKRLAIGVYPKVSCETALAVRDDAKAQLQRGIDPSETKRRLIGAERRALSRKSAFRADLSVNGVLTIETDTKVVRLTAAQTNVLREILNAAPISNDGKG